jgi:hypothetical protein
VANALLLLCFCFVLTVHFGKNVAGVSCVPVCVPVASDWSFVGVRVRD